jgi:putative hemolysin
LLTELVALLFLVLVVAGSSAAEAAAVKLNKGRLRHLAGEGVAKARTIVSLVEQGAPLGASMAVANALALSISAIIVLLLIGRTIGYEHPVAYLLSALALLGLIWVQVAFRSIGKRRPEGTLYLLRAPIRALRLLLTPITLLLVWFTRRIFPEEPRIFGLNAPDIEEELRMMVDAAEHEGTLEEEEKDMIESIFTMGERTAREVMVPRVDVAAVNASEPLRAVLETIKTRGHSRIPIYEGTIDNVVGVVHVKELLRDMEVGSLDKPARSLARPPYFIPESKKIDELLKEMQRDKTHLAIVVDEYGGTAGIVTIEDLVEEIVGDIQDEYDIEEKLIEKINDQEAIFDSRVSIHDVNETLDIMLTNGEYDTVGGLVYNRLGKIPVIGDEITVDGVAISVLSTAGKRIKKVKVAVINPEDTESENDNGARE